VPVTPGVAGSSPVHSANVFQQVAQRSGSIFSRANDTAPQRDFRPAGRLCFLAR